MHCDICGITDDWRERFGAIALYGLSDLNANPAGSLAICGDCLERYARSGAARQAAARRASEARRRRPERSPDRVTHPPILARRGPF